MSLFHSLIKPKTDNSDSQKDNERYNEELLKPYNDNVNYLSGYREYNTDLVYNKDTVRNYNAGINEENHMLEQAFSLQREIPIATMNNVISSLKSKYHEYNITALSVYNSLKEQNKINYLVLCYHLLFQINEDLIEKKLSDEHHNFSFFELKKTILLNFDKEKKQIKFAINIARKDKIFDFTIEALTEVKAVSLTNVSGKKVVVKYVSLDLKGINSDYSFDRVKYDNQLPKNRGLLIDDTRKLNYLSALEKTNQIIENNYQTYGLNPKYQDEKSKKILLYPDYGCFNINNETHEVDELDTQNPLKCQSFWESENYRKNGIWDKKCKAHIECPFYQTGREGDLGGCFDGVCEMPLGITRVGYKKYLASTLSQAETHVNGDYRFLRDLEYESVSNN